MIKVRDTRFNTVLSEARRTSASTDQSCKFQVQIEGPGKVHVPEKCFVYTKNLLTKEYRLSGFIRESPASLENLAGYNRASQLEMKQSITVVAIRKSTILEVAERIYLQA